MKSELAIKRDEWLESEEGKRATDIRTLTLNDAKYLRNRIEAAFLAGAKANEDIHKDICDKLADL